MITSVLFDMGGTLEDIWNDAESKKIEIQRVEEILNAHGIFPEGGRGLLGERVRSGWKRYAAYRDITDEELKPDRIWCDYVLSEYSFDRKQLSAASEELAHMWEVTHYYRTMRPGVPELLKRLRKLNVKMSIISNTPSLYQVFDTLEEYGIRNYFRDVTLSSITGFHKPGADIFKVALRQIQSRPEECVYVGDTISRDVIGACRAGFAKTVQIRSFLTERSDGNVPQNVHADYFIQNIEEVGDIVEDLVEKQGGPSVFLRVE